jgi:hypothetical protein
VKGVGEGRRLGVSTVDAARPVPAPTGYRLLSIVLALELVWLLLVAASLVFLAAHLGADADEITGGPNSRRMLLLTVPPLTVGLGLAVIGARRALERRVAAPECSLRATLRLSLGLTAVANVVLMVSILTSLYHAHATWVLVGLALAAGLGLVAAACARAAHQ